VTIGTIRHQLDAHAKWMDTQDPHFNHMSNQFGAHLSPLRNREVVDILMSYHGAHTFSVFSVN
jgi:hypothetical protein